MLVILDQPRLICYIRASAVKKRHGSQGFGNSVRAYTSELFRLVLFPALGPAHLSQWLHGANQMSFVVASQAIES